MTDIKKVISYGENILVIDQENKIWIMGNNNDRITGFGKKDETIYSPIYTHITLDEDEDISKFYVCGELLSFYTTKGKLYLSKSQGTLEYCLESEPDSDDDNEVQPIRQSRPSTPPARRSRPSTPINRSPVRRIRSIRSSSTSRIPSRHADQYLDSSEDDDDYPTQEEELDWSDELDEKKDEELMEEKKDELDEKKDEESTEDDEELMEEKKKELDEKKYEESTKNELTSETYNSFGNEDEFFFESWPETCLPGRRKEYVINICKYIVQINKEMHREKILVPNLKIIFDIAEKNIIFSLFNLIYDEFVKINPNVLPEIVDEVRDGFNLTFFSNPIKYDEFIESELDHYETRDTQNFSDEEKYDIDFDTSEFYASLENCGRKKDKSDGIYLLAEDVEDVTYVSEAIFFKKNGKICVYEKSALPVDMIFNNLGISAIRVHKYYELIMPFDYQKLIFCENFIYLLNNDMHHIISAYSKISLGCSENIFVWIYFKCNFFINETDIYFCPIEGTAYVKYQNSIYKYSHTIKKIKQFVDNNCKTLIIPLNDNTGKSIVCIKNDGVYLDQGHLCKFMNHYEPLSYMVNYQKLMYGNIVLVDIENYQKEIVHDNTLFFNIHGISRYRLMDNGIIYFDENNNLLYCTDILLDENIYNTMEINRINALDEIFYTYKFNNLPTPISDVEFTNYLIIIKSNDKYYYHAIDSDYLKIDKFTQINNTISDDMNVCKYHVIYDKKIYDNEVTLNVSTTESKKLKKLINIIEMIPKSTNFHINFVKGSQIISYGNGPKRDFMEVAMIEFSDKYLIKHNNCCEFNLDKISKLSDEQLMTIGRMLHAVICHSNNSLPIRLPIILISSILGKNLKIKDLEYYAKIEDPQAYEKLYPYKDDNDMIKTFGYDSYEECLNILCKNHYNEAKKNIVDNICKYIACGFIDYCEIKNTYVMNIPTMDYYISGDYKIDVDLLLEKITFKGIGKKKKSSFIIDMIKSMDQQKLAIFLKNWSGTSIVKRSMSYIINFCNNLETDIHFATCNFELSINKKLFANTKSKNMLCDLLTSPINFMTDLSNDSAVSEYDDSDDE